ncbi:NEDD8-activating enzyme E1 regulatory subunit, variant 2 [Entomophthora muscae]|uniref:NEDD8-activating enzyme E1 regulatory subunit, variant 2 n=1 Tax=Entomophthora muscae TaxID=34485 RepID=A0ACC2UU95_9FUNG|nr:NEDD8-activating enzyme E1 regulatory subunit, variant 2 [Entomophthora muscae]
METPDLSIPDAQTLRYDRQLRLWAQSGQEALGNSHIALLGVTPTGSEILKNMVLSGIHSFTVVDNEDINPLDSNNFFIDTTETSKRGATFRDLILELNPQVKGFHLDLDPVTVLHKPMFFEKFSAVIVSMGLQLNEVFVSKLSEILYTLGIPMVTVDTCGFMGYFRLSCQKHPVIETHPESFNDLRLDVPIPGLEAWADAIDFEASSEQHGNIPYAAILIRYIKLWAKEQEEGTTFPTTYKQKQELKKLIKSGMLSSDEENFEQAIAAVNSMVQARKVPSQVLAIFQNPKCQNINEESSEFWLLARALYEYYKNEGKHTHLPLSGTIPDMKADTIRYIELQKLYKEQASRDVQALQAHLQKLDVTGVKNITPQQVTTMCKNAYYLHLSESIPLHLEWSKSNSKLLDLSSLSANKEQAWLWLAFRARHHVAITANKLLGKPIY